MISDISRAPGVFGNGFAIHIKETDSWRQLGIRKKRNDRLQYGKDDNCKYILRTIKNLPMLTHPSPPLYASSVPYIQGYVEKVPAPSPCRVNNIFCRRETVQCHSLWVLLWFRCNPLPSFSIGVNCKFLQELIEYL